MIYAKRLGIDIKGNSKMGPVTNIIVLKLEYSNVLILFSLSWIMFGSIMYKKKLPIRNETRKEITIWDWNALIYSVSEGKT